MSGAADWRPQDHSEGDSLEAAASVIRSGGVVAFPTDTVYGLGVDPFNPEAVESLFAAKGRPTNSPIPLLIADPADLALVANSAPSGAMALAEAFWPGALTLVLHAVDGLPELVSAGSGTVGVRVPDHPAPRNLARTAGGPITGTSANRSGEPSLKTAKEVRAALGGVLRFVLEGACGAHVAPSTVVNFTVDPPSVVRHGAISIEALQRVRPDIVG
ncbi:MAG TPA: L-threonylcarbamoyladenylate synthase [Dehalococcoidia bacterium]|nr:L-threonylcarbamoyladenylate synthase [Dehalococcoidia bacterium]MDP6273055.1 L-threonylcarbamoyladenylate synthase [Dehalococcoidia bacterium]MDP7161631.1 L-threonylcarbamoyladenylate synthase [Dehalococcoidia bacterium]MDP7213463.1 L-threonylcarbamoyladenylate synthase [Dehalococcoidia bacterium]MDP7514275.1 L-threonylcarbamoyladenylate synthase [Dehalococcoidia bacterium]